MKTKKVSRVLALLLSVVMLLGSLPMALAEEDVIVHDSEYDKLLEIAVQQYYSELMSCETFEELEALMNRISDEQGYTFLMALDEESLAKHEAELRRLYDIYITDYWLPRAANFAKVAPLSKRAAQPAVYSRNALMTFSARAGENDRVVLDKDLTANADGSFNIKLEAYTTGSITVTEGSTPCDIILIVDQSTSMKNNLSDGSSGYVYTEVYSLNQNSTYRVKQGNNYTAVGWCTRHNAWATCYNNNYNHYEGTVYTPKSSASDTTAGAVQFYTREYQTIEAVTRLEALQDAATLFINTTADKENNKIAIVGFHNSAINHTNGALWDATAREDDLVSIINGLGNNLSGATDHDDGLEAAETILSNNPAADGRERIVVLFTDGEPEPQGSGDWSAATVKDAIESAYRIKNTYGASLYVVSVAPGTNAETLSSPMDKYMAYTSSNYPNARYTGNTNISQGWYEEEEEYEGRIVNQITPGERADTGDASFYLTASDIGTLESIFADIANQTGGTSIALNANTQIRDVVTPYFDVPADASAVTVKTYDCLTYDEETGAATWSATGTTLTNAVSIDGDTLTITGFDFNRNFVAETGRVEGDVNTSGDFHGRKIVIEFTITPKDEFWGGNNVPTNGANSGIYGEGAENATGTFDVPHANVPLNVPDLETYNKNVYLYGELPEMSDLYNQTTFVKATGNNAWKTEFVTITDTSGGTISPTDDTTVTIGVSVSASETADENSKGTPVTQPVSQTGTAKVNVFKPVIDFNDSVVVYKTTEVGDAYYASENNNGVTAWKHGNTASADVTMTGEPPTDFAYTYAVIENDTIADIVDNKVAVQSDVPINVSKVTLGGNTIYEDGTNVNYVTFTHTDCDFAGCTWDDDSMADAAGAEFLLHTEKGNLTVKKTVADASDMDQEFEFTVTLSDTNIDGKFGDAAFTNGVATFKLKHNGSMNISGLPVGISYTVTESSYSTFTTDKTGYEGTIEADATKTAAFTNTMQTGNLTITKRVVDKSFDNGSRVFTFTVAPVANASDDMKAQFKAWAGDKDTHTVTVTVNGTSNDTDTGNTPLVGLPVGNYVVTETGMKPCADYYAAGTTTANATVSNGGTAEVTITNTADLMTISVQKVWADDDNKLGLRPDSVQVQLKNGTTDVGNAITLSKDSWTNSWSDLPKYDESGNAITYSVEELEVPFYESQTSGNQTQGFKITNTIDAGHLKITKTVEPLNGQTSVDQEFTFRVTLTPPTGVTLADEYAYSVGNASGNVTVANNEFTISLKHGQTAAIKGLPKDTEYSIEETAAGSFEVKSKTGENGTIAAGKVSEANFVNTYQTGNLKIIKDVDDATFANGSRTFTFTVKLNDSDVFAQAQFKDWAEDKPYTWNSTDKTATVTVTVASTDTDLKNEVILSGLPIGSYTVTETNTTGYYTTTMNGTSGYAAIVTVSDDGTAEVTAVNTAVLISVDVTKVWEDEGNKNNTRPDSITVTLSGNGEEYEATLTADGEWKHTWPNIPKYTTSGTEIAYSVSEGEVPLYTKGTPTGNAASGFQITNTLNTTSLTIEKKAANGTTIGSDENFVFTVKNESGSVNYTIVITGEGSKTIDGLLVGEEITVEELTGWSWRYDENPGYQDTDSGEGANSTDGKITLKMSGNKVTVINEKTNDKWLTDETKAENKFDSTTTTN